MHWLMSRLQKQRGQRTFLGGLLVLIVDAELPRMALGIYVQGYSIRAPGAHKHRASMQPQKYNCQKFQPKHGCEPINASLGAIRCRV